MALYTSYGVDAIEEYLLKDWLQPECSIIAHSSEFKSNFQKLFNVGLPHLDTVQDFFELLPPAELEKIKTGLIKRLIEKKVFYKYKILGHYMITFDATVVVSCDTDRFGCGLKRESKRSLPALQDCLKDDPPTERNSFVYHPVCTLKNNTVTQQFYWVEDLLHKKHTLHYLQCKETIRNEKTNKTLTQNFVRITNLATNKTTVKNLSKAGRLRWKIENEGFNEQKNNGYAMEHLYSRDSFNALQNYCQSMLIAHLLNQLVEHSCKIQELLKRFTKLTIKYLWQQFLCTMKCQLLCEQILATTDNKKHQVRLYSD